MSADDAQRARGNVSYEGRWLTPAEHEAAVREREMDAAASVQLREADLRVQEAEARVREAEARAREAEAAADQTNGGIPLGYAYGNGYGYGYGYGQGHGPGGFRPSRPGHSRPGKPHPGSPDVRPSTPPKPAPAPRPQTRPAPPIRRLGYVVAPQPPPARKD